MLRIILSHRCLGESDADCPTCARAHGLVREIVRSNLQFADRHDLFLTECAILRCFVVVSLIRPLAESKRATTGGRQWRAPFPRVCSPLRRRIRRSGSDGVGDTCCSITSASPALRAAERGLEHPPVVGAGHRPSDPLLLSSYEIRLPSYVVVCVFRTRGAAALATLSLDDAYSFQSRLMRSLDDRITATGPRS
jgi:hypothetical protein